MTDRERRHELVVELNRKDFCFFWSYREGMMTAAGETLREREAANRAAARDRRHTIVGLWIAAAALAVDAYFNVAERLMWWPF